MVKFSAIVLVVTIALSLAHAKPLVKRSASPNPKTVERDLSLAYDYESEYDYHGNFDDDVDYVEISDAGASEKQPQRKTVRETEIELVYTREGKRNTKQSRTKRNVAPMARRGL